MHGRLRPLARAGRRPRSPRTARPETLRRRPAGGAHRLDRLGDPAAGCSRPTVVRRLNEELGHGTVTVDRGPRPARADLEEGPPLGARRPRSARHLRLSRPGGRTGRSDGPRRRIGTHPAPCAGVSERLHRPLQGRFLVHRSPRRGGGDVECGLLTRYHGRSGRHSSTACSGPLHVRPAMCSGHVKRCACPTSPVEPEPAPPPQHPDDVEYDASAIQVLEGLEAVRKRPGMYIGSTGERGLHHLIWEIVDNAVDEALAGYCDRIVLTLQRRRRRSGSRTTAAASRPTPRPARSCPRVTLALTVLHAGGKFGGGGYKVSGGLHGVGVSVVNALSSRLDRRGPQPRPPVAPDLHPRRARRRRSSRSGRWSRARAPAPRSPTGPPTTSSRPRRTPSRRSPPGSARWPSSTRASRSSSATSGPRPTRSPRPSQDDTVDNDVDQAGADAIQRGEGGGLEQVFKYDRGLVDYVEHLNRRKEHGQPDGHLLRGRDARRRRATT